MEFSYCNGVKSIRNGEKGLSKGQGMIDNTLQNSQSDTAESMHVENHPTLPDNSIQQNQIIQDAPINLEVSSNSTKATDEEEELLEAFRYFFNDNDENQKGAGLSLFEDTPAGIPKEIIEKVSAEDPFLHSIHQNGIDLDFPNLVPEQHHLYSAANGNVKNAYKSVKNKAFPDENENKQNIDPSLIQNNQSLSDSEMDEDESDEGKTDSSEMQCLKKEKRGRKPKYSTEKERKVARNKSSKKYNQNNTFQIRKANLVNDINGFESENLNLHGSLNLLKNQFLRKFNKIGYLFSDVENRQIEQKFMASI
uniref:BZIP domain-containing protein n=1 Tax=Panagrolaimus sp. ES5 TaxID=591445 RepID=A0AC34G4B6_9BILA